MQAKRAAPHSQSNSSSSSSSHSHGHGNGHNNTFNTAPSGSLSAAAAAARRQAVLSARFGGGEKGGTPRDSPVLRPQQKRPRAPPSPTTFPALADAPRYDSDMAPGTNTGHGHGSAGACHQDLFDESDPWCGLGKEVEGGSSSSSMALGTSGLTSFGSGSAERGDWRIVLYHDRNVVMYNPRETPAFRSRRLTSVEEAPTGSTLATTYGRCPLCRQTVDSRFAFAAQAYFDLLQGFHRSSGTAAAVDPSDEVDVLGETDLYRILGVTRKANLEEIKRAYRKRSLRFHPDKNHEDADAKPKFQKVAEAFSVLSDEHKRAKYDQSGDMDLEDFDVEQFMEMVNAWGFKYQQSPSANLDAETQEDLLLEAADSTPSGGFALGNNDNNPYLAPEASSSAAAAAAVVASEGGAEAEAAAAAALQNLPAGLLNTGYYTRFFIETQKLGSGSWGSVFLCRHVLCDLELGDYAVKKVPVGDNKAWLRDMIREVKMFERLHHPNIVEYKHSWLELSRSSPFCPLVPFLFILMQYCNGGSLDELIWPSGKVRKLKDPSPMSVAQIWHVLLDVLQGLQHLHQQGILHRDLKPTNILLQNPAKSGSGFPRALLSDFGTATPFGEPLAGANTSRGYTGTVEYTAPELLQGGQLEFTEKSDMWSLGIVLYAMCFSRVPWSHDDPSVLKATIRRFAEERGFGCEASDAGSEDEADSSSWLPRDEGGRLGPLPLVLAALLELRPERRPSATDLLENPTFRRQAVHYSRCSTADPFAALADS